MKTHHSSGALSCGMGKNTLFISIILKKMQCFRTKISIQVTPLARGVTSASKLR